MGLTGWIWPGTVVRLRDEARELYQTGRYQAAEWSYTRLAQMVPQSPEVLFNRGNALYRLERYEEALQTYQRAQQLDRAGRWAPHTYYNSGNALFCLHRLAEAEQAYRSAIEAARAAGIRDEDAEYNLALVRYLRSRPFPASSDPIPEDRSRPDKGPEAGESGTNTSPDSLRGVQQRKSDPYSSRPRRKPEYGLTEQEVDRLLRQLEADERQLQRYFNRRLRSESERSPAVGLGEGSGGQRGHSSGEVGSLVQGREGKDW